MVCVNDSYDGFRIRARNVDRRLGERALKNTRNEIAGAPPSPTNN